MVTLRPARPDDEADLRAVDLATWTDAVSPGPVPPPGRPFLDADTVLADLLVAEVAGTAVGYVRLTQTGPLPSHVHVLTVNGLAVAPSHQGTGLGRALLQGAVELASGRGASKVTLRVLAPNQVARRLYERCGFVVEGTLRDEFLLAGELVDDVQMAHHLGGAGLPTAQEAAAEGVAGRGNLHRQGFVGDTQPGELQDPLQQA